MDLRSERDSGGLPGVGRRSATQGSNSSKNGKNFLPRRREGREGRQSVLDVRSSTADFPATFAPWRFKGSDSGLSALVSYESKSTQNGKNISLIGAKVAKKVQNVSRFYLKTKASPAFLGVL
jgi:hypothetical protein